ncbi:lipopolysaccharide biosynthesis protein [Aliikangiella sp. IMCC44359]|uniref:lipopolysaccharide biosynthesis protein n=1 Tax=Aliikangiella sp. IMCC44359 TaxID=3459125 RepID=UPI00403A9614
MFIQNILKLVTGTVIAQVLPFFVLPFLTRSMGGEKFGVYSLFFTTMIMLGTLSALRFDHAINAAKTAIHAKLIFFLCIAINLFALIIIFVFILAAILFDYLSNIWFLLPFTIFIMSINQSYYLYANYLGEFSAMSRSRIVNAVGCALTQFFLVVVIDFHVGAFGGLLLGFVVSTYYLYIKLPLTINHVTIKQLTYIFKRYISYPKLVFPGSFINFLSGNMPIYVIGFLFGAAQAGYYSLAERVAGVPTSMIGRSIGEVYRKRANEELRAKGNFHSIFVKVASMSFVISLVGFCIPFIFAKPLIEFVFGQGWDDAAFYMQILIPIFILQFSTASIAYSLMLVNWQKQEFYWQIFRFLLMSSTLFCSFVFFETIESFVIASSISLSISYSVYFFLCYKSAKGASYLAKT